MVLVTDQVLLQRLKEQRDFLSSELSEYELGKTHFAYKIAQTLRIIFHRTESSSPILPDLAYKYGYQFMLKGRNPPPRGKAVFYAGFTMSLGGRNRESILRNPLLVSKKFEEHWDEVVYFDAVAQYKRSQFILWAANKLGGAHVDPVIPRELEEILEEKTRIKTSYGEESIINHVVYEMGVHVITALDQLIPYLKSKIAEQTKYEVNKDSLMTYIKGSDEVRYWNNLLRTDKEIGHRVDPDNWGNLFRDVRIADFLGLKSIQDIDSTLRSARGWGEVFLKRLYIDKFAREKSQPQFVSTVVNGVVTYLMLASNAEKLDETKLSKDFGFGDAEHARHFLELARDAKQERQLEQLRG